MDNAAFRALVNQGRKSTKEIAREAVETEFHKKKRRGGGGGRRGGGGGRGGDEGYASDSGGSSDDDEGGDASRAKKKEENQEETSNNEPDWKRRRREKKHSSDNHNGGTATSGVYRDRAKERREGKNVDYADSHNLAIDSTSNPNNNLEEIEEERKRQAELTKYLGGDEEHTHLVKGLDWALAQKVRREEMGGLGFGGGEEGDLDVLMEQSIAKKQQVDGSGKKKTKEGWQSVEPACELGKSMLSYLTKRERMTSSNAPTTTATRIKPNPALQKSIQRSILTFSLDSDVCRRSVAWEAPRLSVQVASSSNGVMSGGGYGLHGNRSTTPLDHQLLVTISKKLSGDLGRGGSSKKGGRQKEQRVGLDGEKEDVGGEVAARDSAAKDESEEVSNARAASGIKEEDSDDDIFGDIGNYIPPAATVKDDESKKVDDVNNDTSTENNTSKPKKQSIFDNLIPETNHITPAPTQSKPRQLPQQQSVPAPNDTNVINRDVIGASSSDNQLFTKRRGPQTAAMQGVSMANYSGGYGEEMDVDFGNFDEDGYKKRKGREKDGSNDKAEDYDDGGDEED
eukprot:g4865.t1 g4865   contig18:104598-106301(+)